MYGAKYVRALLLGQQVAGILTFATSEVNAILCRLIPSESRGTASTRGATEHIHNAVKQEARPLVHYLVSWGGMSRSQLP